MTLSDTGDSDYADEHDIDYNPPEKHRGRKPTKKIIFTPRMIAALDKCKVTNREAMHIISSVVIALGQPLDEIILNRNSLVKYRKEHRKQIAEEVQNSYKVSNE